MLKEKVIIIIPTYNRNSYLSSLLKDLSKQSVKCFQVVIVDASDEKSALNVVCNFNNLKIRYLNIESSNYWTGSINEGLKLVLSYKYAGLNGVVLLNDDVKLNSDYMEYLGNSIISFPNSLIGSLNVSAEDMKTVIWAGSRTNKWTSYTSYPLKGKLLDFISIGSFQESFTLIGRGLYIPLEVFYKIGLFNKKIPHRGDTEFPLRAKKVGFRLIVSNDLIVYTYESLTYNYEYGKLKWADFKKLFFDFRSSSQWKNRYYYAESATSNRLQHLCFFTLNMIISLRRFILRVLT